MEKTDSYSYSIHEKLNLRLRKSAEVLEVCEKLASSDKLHDKEQLIVRLKNVIHSNQKWMVSLQQDCSLQICRIKHLTIQNRILAQRLHSIVLSIAFLLNKKDFAKSSLSNYFLYFKVTQVDLLFGFISLI